MISEEHLNTRLSKIMYEKIRPPMANSSLTIMHYQSEYWARCILPMRPIVVFFSKFLLFPLTLDFFFLLYHYILSCTLWHQYAMYSIKLWI